jgi:hypothetical protein
MPITFGKVFVGAEPQLAIVRQARSAPTTAATMRFGTF